MRKEIHFPQLNVASYKRQGIRLCFEYTTTLFPGEGVEGRISTATIFRKRLSNYAIFKTVLFKIVARIADRIRSGCCSFLTAEWL